MTITPEKIVASWAPSPEQKQAEVGLMAAYEQLAESLHPSKLPHALGVTISTAGNSPFPIPSQGKLEMEELQWEWCKWTREWRVNPRGEEWVCIIPEGYQGACPQVLLA